MVLFNKMITINLQFNISKITNTLKLLNEGPTIPFISRYRKEATGRLDEVQIEQIKNLYDTLCDIAKRK